MPAPEPLQDTQSVFVCYSRADMARVDAIVTGLKGLGHKIWIDRIGIVGSETWRTKIVDALEECLAVIFFGSQSSYASRHVATELALAEGARKPIVPVLLDDSQPAGDMRFYLARPHHLKCAGRDHRQVVAEIHAALRNIAQPGIIPLTVAPVRRISRSGAGGWIGGAAGLAALALVGWHYGFRQPSDDRGKDSKKDIIVVVPPADPGGEPETPTPLKGQEDEQESAPLSDQESQEAPPQKVLPQEAQPQETPPQKAPQEDNRQEARQEDKPQKVPPDDKLQVAVTEPVPDWNWLAKGSNVVVTRPISPGVLSDRNGRPLALTVSFDNGEKLKISDEVAAMIELSDQAMGRGWLKKSEAETYLKSTP